MKNSGIEWLGEIPLEWKAIKLKFLCAIRTGGTLPKVGNNNFYSTNGLLWIKPDDLSEFIPIIDTKEYINNLGIKKINVFPKNTLFVCCIGTIGKIGYTNQNAYCNQQINGLIFNDNIVMRFGMYAVYAQEKQHWYYSNGNVIKILNSSNQSRIEIAVPSKEEQQKIADYLDKKCAAVDRLIENQQAQIEKLKEYKQSVITEAVTRGLDSSALLKDSGVEWLGKIPSHWITIKNKIIFRNISIKNHGDETVLSLYRDYGVIPKDSRDDNYNVTSLDTDSYKFVECGDLVINKMKAWQGSLAISDYQGIISPAYYICKVNYSYVTNRFIHHYLRNRYLVELFEMLSSGLRIGQWDLAIEDFLNIEIALPPTLKEQEFISEVIDKKCVEIDKLIAIKQQKIETLTEYKKSLIYEYVTGKKQVG